MRTTVKVAAAVLCAVGLTMSSWGIDIPLEYQKNPSQRVPDLRLASISIAAHDLLAAGASPPAASMDFVTSRASNLSLVSDYPTTEAVAGGQRCRSGRFAVRVEDMQLRDPGRGDLYVLISYFDEGPTDTIVRAFYNSTMSRDNAEVTITNSGTWKQHQFRLVSPNLGPRDASTPDFTLYAVPTYGFSTYGNASIQAKPQPPPGSWKLPELTGEQPLYGLVRLGDTSRLLVVDRETSSDPGYTRLRFDANANRDLTDDKVLTATADSMSTGSWHASFPPIDTTVEVDGATLPYSFSCSIYQFAFGGVRIAPENRVQISLNSNCHYRGQFAMGGQQYLLAIGDGNCNGRFDDRLSIPANSFMLVGGDRVPFIQGDKLYLTTGTRLDYYDSQILGDTLVLGDKTLCATVSDARRQMTLVPTTATLASLRLPVATSRLEIYTNDAKHSVMAVEPTTEIQVPEGQYKLHSYSLKRTDDQGDQWRLMASGSNVSPQVAVSSSSTAELVYGEPYQPTVKGNMLGRSGVQAARKGLFSSLFGSAPRATGPVSLELNVRGAGKEVVSDISHLSGTLTRVERSAKNASRPKEASYRIVKADGEVMTQGDFEYG